MVRLPYRMLLLAALSVALANLPILKAQPITTNLDKEFERFRRKPIEPSGEARNRAGNLRDNGMPAPAQAADKAALEELAKYYVYRLTDPKYYAPAESASTELKPRPVSQYVTQVIADARANIHPGPGTGVSDTSTWDEGRRTYVAEFGAALDKAILEILQDPKRPPAILRLSATRMLAAVCESGAPAHWKTVLALLQDPKIEPEVADYALKAAEHLFGSYELKRGWMYDNKPWVDEKTYVDLVLAVERFALKPPPFLHMEASSTRKPGAAVDPKTLTTGEAALFRFYRVQAVRALGRLRQDTIGGRDTEAVRPILTLARFAVGDPSIVPAPTSKEAAEAVIGLCTVQPDNLMIDDVAFAVAHGLKLFAGDDKTIHWKTTAERFRAAMAAWRLNVQRVNRFGDKEKRLVSTLIETATTGIIDPLTKPSGVGSRLDVTKVDAWLAQNMPADKADGSFIKDSSVKIAFPK